MEKERKDYVWSHHVDDLDWEELSELYRLAPLRVEPPEFFKTVFENSRFKCVGRWGGRLVAAGRALSDGLDCAYIADVAVHPDHQGRGVGREVVSRLVDMADGHNKVMLYAIPGTERFYRRLGFLPLNTAHAIWHDPEAAIRSGILRRL